MLPLPTASVNAFAATSMLADPSAVGVNVAVYAAPLPEKLLKVPLVTVTSSTPKSVVDSLDVNVSDSVASFVVSPSFTSAAVIVIVGGVVSVTTVTVLSKASPAITANLLLSVVEGRVSQFVRSGFKQVPGQDWAAQWQLLSAVVFRQ